MTAHRAPQWPGSSRLVHTRIGGKDSPSLATAIGTTRVTVTSLNASRLVWKEKNHLPPRLLESCMSSQGRSTKKRCTTEATSGKERL